MFPKLKFQIIFNDPNAEIKVKGLFNEWFDEYLVDVTDLNWGTFWSKIIGRILAYVGIEERDTIGYCS